ncbi:MAG: potassium transporter Kup [Rhodocyclaceae bacterium]|jgi:KUP system potassium uptake protein|nr:potassium transporter Kup [Microcystis sp. M116S2]MCA3002952.1 potassium transporter Kup [Rhodocyclaceae bacterium]MCA2789399.1 potassium transporter Kup [Microcystis sp. M116S2]MCA3021976.1 potassium transporter Kup [Rhodocyclaceae bacterium]MCA3027622.1 potassium transporter Kup [Rhodocyclaceae bacterium]MCA3053345.1 potassium transporter Kup [Rhodocyclaceae bacterium]
MESKDKKLSALTIGAIGVVFGDIGTSPLYALKESFSPIHGIPLNATTVYGILSVMFWAMTALVTVKYLVFMMRADNKGEGGILALTALAQRCFRKGTRRHWWVVALGMFGAAMFYGDAIITPAISVLSAVEGLGLVEPALNQFVVPISIGILIALFAVQRHGTAAVGLFFGPVMVLWFLVLAILGMVQIVNNPAVLQAFNPWYSWQFFIEHKVAAWITLGAVVLCVTGGEALYADMGHFGRKPIRVGWFSLVWPALLLNYFGQGALLLSNPDAIKNPFYLMAPNWALLPMVGLAACATVIASQAVISGAFSLTKQAIQLGYLPRFNIQHTNEKESGQIYIPFINWGLLIGIITLVIIFKNSSNLAAAYGIAVMLTMTIDTLLLLVVMVYIWKWSRFFAAILVGGILTNDLMFLSATATKIGDGGWFPLVIGVAMFTVMSTWRRGREIVRRKVNDGAMPLKGFVESISLSDTPRVEGTGVFMTTNPDGVPNALLHNLKHNKVLHGRVIILSIVIEDIPRVPKEDYIWIDNHGHGFYTITAHYGFKESPNVPVMLEDCRLQSMKFDMMDTSFFVNRESLIATPKGGMALWREHIFVWMSHLAAKASDYFRIPTNRVVELGTQVEI